MQNSSRDNDLCLCLMSLSRFVEMQTVSIFLQSYMGKASLVVMAAENVVPDPEVLCDYCVKSLQDMRRSAALLARGEMSLDDLEVIKRPIKRPLSKEA